MAASPLLQPMFRLLERHEYLTSIQSLIRRPLSHPISNPLIEPNSPKLRINRPPHGSLLIERMFWYPRGWQKLESFINDPKGNKIFNTTAKPIPCVVCHGIKADGLGLIYQQLKPFSRNFTCYQTMKDLSDGQLFRVIQKGSHGTRMPGFAKLKDKEIWQLVHYIRSTIKIEEKNQ